MKYTWIVLALAGLDQGIKQNIEDQEDQTLPRDLPCAKGWIRLHKNHNAGFPFGVMKNRPQLVQTIPLMMTSALAGALAALSGRREGLAEKLGLAVALGRCVVPFIVPERCKIAVAQGLGLRLRRHVQ